MTKKSQTSDIAVVGSTGESLAAFAGFQIAEDNGIQFLNGTPLDYRANCEKLGGFFVLNGTSNEGDELLMKILNYRLHEQVQLAEIFGVEDVVEVIFVDPNNAIASLLLRTYSKDNFLKLMQTLMVKKTPAATQIVKATMSQKTTNKNTYYIVEFTSENSTEEAVKELKEFYNIAPDAFTAFREIGTGE